MTDLVLLHGWGLSRTAFDGLARPLSARCAVVAMSLPGYDGAVAPEPYTLDKLASDVAGRAPARCAVLGWSLGALVALAWAALAPSQVEKLVLVGATPSFVQRADWPYGIAPDVLASFEAALGSDRERTLRRFVGLVAHGDAYAKTVTHALQRAVADARTSSETLRGGLRLLLESDVRALLPPIGQPTLIVHGQRDQLAPIGAGKYIASTLPRAELQTIDDAGHAPFVAHPEPLAQRITDFLHG